jgi:hypothetical protein
MHTTGSIAPALLWDQFDGFTPRARFQVDVPLPRLNERFHAFIGRVNRDEFVTERQPGSGAFARQYGPLEDDETLLGIRYREPRQGGSWDADAGLRLTSPLDPFVKGKIANLHAAVGDGYLSVRRPGDAASENTFEGFVALRVTAELSDKITGVIEFGTKRADSGVINYFAAPSGTGSAAISLQLREANITIQELFLPEIKLQAGISTWSFDIRGKGQSLAFDPRHSQRFNRNVNAGPDTDTALFGRAGDRIDSSTP